MDENDEIVKYTQKEQQAKKDKDQKKVELMAEQYVEIDAAKGKRGRPRKKSESEARSLDVKNSKEQQQELEEDDEFVKDIQKSKQAKKEYQRMPLTAESCVEKIPSFVPEKRKRGRPRKKSHNESLKHSLNHSKEPQQDVDNEELVMDTQKVQQTEKTKDDERMKLSAEECVENVPLDVSEKRKRGRPRKKSECESLALDLNDNKEEQHGKSVANGMLDGSPEVIMVTPKRKRDSDTVTKKVRILPEETTAAVKSLQPATGIEDGCIVALKEMNSDCKTKQKSPGKRRITRGIDPESLHSVAAVDQNCALCPSLYNDESDDDETLVGPYTLLVGQPPLYVHLECALWAPEVYALESTDVLNGPALVNVATAYRRGRRLKCVLCHERGATLGCFVDSCTRTFHRKCVLNGSKCVTIPQDFKVYCSVHASRSKKLTTTNHDTTPSSEQQANQSLSASASPSNAQRLSNLSIKPSDLPYSIDANLAQQREISQKSTPEVIAERVLNCPHSKYTLLARHETEVMFSRRARIVSHSSVPVNRKDLRITFTVDDSSAEKKPTSSSEVDMMGGVLSRNTFRLRSGLRAIHVDVLKAMENLAQIQECEVDSVPFVFLLRNLKYFREGFGDRFRVEKVGIAQIQKQKKNDAVIGKENVNVNKSLTKNTTTKKKSKEASSSFSNGHSIVQDSDVLGPGKMNGRVDKETDSQSTISDESNWWSQKESEIGRSCKQKSGGDTGLIGLADYSKELTALVNASRAKKDWIDDDDDDFEDRNTYVRSSQEVRKNESIKNSQAKPPRHPTASLDPHIRN
uniref:PHD-type domain-containing protein n=1 Tax=Timspurckia oligopyrenoides TaxID=708627 RepID=A0A7S1EQ47_9RHOD